MKRGWPKGKPLTKEMRVRLSVSRMGSGNPFYGRKHTEETRRKMSESKLGPKNNRYGVKHTEESKIKMSITRKGKYKGPAHWSFGKPVTEEVKNKIRATLRSGENF